MNESDLLKGDPVIDVVSDEQLVAYRGHVRRLQREIADAVSSFWNAWLSRSPENGTTPGAEVGHSNPAQ